MMGAKCTSVYQKDERTNLDHPNKCQHCRIELEIISIIANMNSSENCEINMWNGFNLILIANLIYFSIEFQSNFANNAKKYFISFRMQY